MEIRGHVENIVSSPGRGRAEGKTAYAIVVQGESFSVGFNPPSVKVGDLVRFDVKVDGRWKSAWNVRIDNGSAAPPPARSGSIPRAESGPPAGAGCGDLRLLAAAVVVAAFVKQNEPGWALEDIAANVLDVAKQLERR